MEKIKTINPLLSQIFLRKWGMFCSTYLGNDLYYLKEYVDMAINDLGEEKVIEMLKNNDGDNKKRCNEIGNDWDNFRKKLNKFDRLLNKTKGFYDKIEDKKFTKINERDIKEFMRLCMKLPLIKQDLYTLAVFLINNTSLHRMTVPTEAFKILEHKHFRKIDLSKKPKTREEVEIGEED